MEISGNFCAPLENTSRRHGYILPESPTRRDLEGAEQQGT
jgi:hypothetical protein